MSAPKIALDVESTLVKTHHRMLEIYNERHDTDYRHSQIGHWDWVRDEIDFDEFMQIIETEWNENPLGFKKREVNLDLAVEKLSNVGDVDLVTARQNCDEGMKKWFDHHGIEHYQKYRTVPPETDKTDLGYSVFIDDNPKIADNLGPDQYQYLILQPYNYHVQDKDRVVPVKNVHSAFLNIENDYQ